MGPRISIFQLHVTVVLLPFAEEDHEMALKTKNKAMKCRVVFEFRLFCHPFGNILNGKYFLHLRKSKSHFVFVLDRFRSFLL